MTSLLFVLGGIGSLVLLIGGGLFAYFLSRSGKEQYAAQNEIVPGRSTGAPAEWGGAHTTEAKLHRRLVQSAQAIRSNMSVLGISLVDEQVTLEEQALELDRRLVTASQLPGDHKAEQLAVLSEQVAAFETRVAETLTRDLQTPLAGESSSATMREIEDLAQANWEHEFSGDQTITPDELPGTSPKG